MSEKLIYELKVIGEALGNILIILITELKQFIESIGSLL